LDTLGVQGLGSVNKTTELYSTWPDREQWALYTSKLMQWMPTLLSDEERETLEEKLSAVESTFNTYLSQPDADNKDQPIAELRELLKQLEEIEALICDRGSHAAYPYFARWFTLNLAVVKAFLNYEKRAGQLRGLKLWWSGRYYLERVFHSAYTARASQVITSVTGAFMDRIYVRDERTDTPLTIDVRMGGEDEIAVLNIQKFLRSEAGWKYIQDISLEQSVKILGQVRNALTVTTDSPTKQDQVLDASQFWRDKQERIEYEIAEQRKACDPAFDHLINHEARKQSLPAAKMGAKTLVGQKAAQPQKADQQQLVEAFINAYQPLVVATGKTPDERNEIEKNFPSAIKIVSEVVPNLIGMIPIVGDFLGPIYGMFFSFLGQKSKPNPWVEFEKKMELLVKNAISDFDANNVRNRLRGFDDELNLFINDYDRESKKVNGITLSDLAIFKGRASKLFSDVYQFKTSIVDPASNSYFKVAPYYEHFFVMYIVVLAVAEKMNVGTYDFVDLRTTLYNNAHTFIERAINGIFLERGDDIFEKDVSTCGTYNLVVYDNRLQRELSCRVNGLTIQMNRINCSIPEMMNDLLQFHKAVAGLMSSIQTVQELAGRLDGIIKQDSQSSFDKGKIKEVYESRIAHFHDVVKQRSQARCIRMNEWYIFPDTVRVIVSKDLKNLGKKPPMTMYHIPMPVNVTVGTYYYIFSKVSNKALDVAGGSTENMANIQQYSQAEVDQQKWRLEDAGDGHYYLVSKKSGKVVAVNSSNKNVVLYDKISTAQDQKWRLEDGGHGYYYLVSKQSNEVLDMSGSLADGANVQVYTKVESDNLKWSFEGV